MFPASFCSLFADFRIQIKSQLTLIFYTKVDQTLDSQYSPGCEGAECQTMGLKQCTFQISDTLISNTNVTEAVCTLLGGVEFFFPRVSDVNRI